MTPDALPPGADSVSVYVISVLSQSRSPTASAVASVEPGVYVYENRFGSSIWKSRSCQPAESCHLVWSTENFLPGCAQFVPPAAGASAPALVTKPAFVL